MPSSSSLVNLLSLGGNKRTSSLSLPPGFLSVVRTVEKKCHDERRTNSSFFRRCLLRFWGADRKRSPVNLESGSIVSALFRLFSCSDLLRLDHEISEVDLRKKVAEIFPLGLDGKFTVEGHSNPFSDIIGEIFSTYSKLRDEFICQRTLINGAKKSTDLDQAEKNFKTSTDGIIDTFSNLLKTLLLKEKKFLSYYKKKPVVKSLSEEVVVKELLNFTGLFKKHLVVCSERKRQESVTARNQFWLETTKIWVTYGESIDRKVTVDNPLALETCKKKLEEATKNLKDTRIFDDEFTEVVEQSKKGFPLISAGKKQNQTEEEPVLVSSPITTLPHDDFATDLRYRLVEDKSASSSSSNSDIRHSPHSGSTESINSADSADSTDSGIFNFAKADANAKHSLLLPNKASSLSSIRFFSPPSDFVDRETLRKSMENTSKQPSSTSSLVY